MTAVLAPPHLVLWVEGHGVPGDDALLYRGCDEVGFCGVGAGPAHIGRAIQEQAEQPGVAEIPVRSGGAICMAWWATTETAAGLCWMGLNAHLKESPCVLLGEAAKSCASLACRGS